MSVPTPSDADAATEPLPSAEELVRASKAAGFAMVEGLPEEPEHEKRQGHARGAWQRLEHYVAQLLGGSRLRPSSLGA